MIPFCSLTILNLVIQTHTLSDCKATAIGFMDQHFAHLHPDTWQELWEKRQIQVINVSTIEWGDMLHLAQVEMEILDYKEQIPILVTKLRYYHLVLRTPLLRIDDVAIRFEPSTALITSQYITTHCHDTSFKVQVVLVEPPEQIYEQKSLSTAPIYRPRQFGRNLGMVSGTAFFRTVKKWKLTIFGASLYNIYHANKAKDLKERPLQKVIPKHYGEFLLRFITVLADRLPPH